jgi:hypothetical protein
MFGLPAVLGDIYRCVPQSVCLIVDLERLDRKKYSFFFKILIY